MSTIDALTAAMNSMITDANMDQAMAYMSENDKITNLAQIQTQAMAIQQSTLDMEMQRAATLEQSIESLDVSLQTSQMDYVAQMTAEENEHVETMAMAAAGLTSLESTYSTSSDLPEPTSTDTSGETSSDYSSESSDNSYLDYLYSLEGSTSESGATSSEASSSDQSTIDYLNGLFS